MYKLILKITLIISLLLNSAGEGYALRPAASGVSTKKKYLDPIAALFKRPEPKSYELYLCIVEQLGLKGKVGVELGTSTCTFECGSLVHAGMKQMVMVDNRSLPKPEEIKDNRIILKKTNAKNLSFRKNSFDLALFDASLVEIAIGLKKFDVTPSKNLWFGKVTPEEFEEALIKPLSEACRVLNPNGYLVVYEEIDNIENNKAKTEIITSCLEKLDLTVTTSVINTTNDGSGPMLIIARKASDGSKVDNTISSRVKSEKSSSAGGGFDTTLKDTRNLKEAVATLIHQAQNDPLKLKRITFDLAALLLSEKGPSFQYQISADLIWGIHHIRNYYKNILKVYGQALVIASSVNPKLKRFFKPSYFIEAGKPFNDYQRSKNRLAGFYRDEEFAMDFVNAFGSEPKLNKPWYVDSQFAILDCIDGIEFKTQSILESTIKELTRQLEEAETLNALVKKRLKFLIESLKQHGLKRGETFNERLIREFMQARKRKPGKTDLFKAMQLIRKRGYIEIDMDHGIEYIDIVGEIKPLSDAYWVLLKQALGDSRINYRQEALCYPDTPPQGKRPSIILYYQDEDGSISLADPQLIQKAIEDESGFRSYVIFEEDEANIFPIRRRSPKNNWEYILLPNPATMPKVPELSVNKDITLKEIMSYLYYLSDRLMDEDISQESWPLLIERIRRNLKELRIKLGKLRKSKDIKKALVLVESMYTILDFFQHRWPVRTWLKRILNAKEPETKVFSLPLDSDTPSSEIKTKQILKWSFPKEKNRDKLRLKVETFLGALEEKVESAGFVIDFRNMDLPCFEMIVNGMAYGKGLDVEVYSGTDKQGLKVIIAIGRDRGPGVTNPNQLLQDSYKTRVGMIAELAGQEPVSKKMSRGRGFSHIVDWPKDVIFDTKSKRFVRIGKEGWHFTLAYSGTSDVKKGMKITLIWQERGAKSLIMKVEQQLAYRKIDAAA